MPGQMIPYKSTNEMMLSIASGQTLFGFADPPIVIPLAQGGKIRLLAMTGPSRLPELPEAPTAAEAGFGNVDARLPVDRCIRHHRNTASDRAKTRGSDPPSARGSGRARQTQGRGLRARR